MSSKITSSVVVSAMVESARATVTAKDAAKAALSTFESLVKITADALSANVSANSIAQAAKAEVTADRTLRGVMYTSPGSITWLARTGRVMKLAGSLPDGITAIDVQSVITKTPAAKADEIIGKAASKSDTYDALVKAAKAAKAAADKAAADKAAGDAPTVDAPSGDAPTADTADKSSAANLLGQAHKLIMQAVALGSEKWDVPTIDEVVKIMSALEAFESVTAPEVAETVAA